MNNNFILTLDNLITQKECKDLIKNFNNNLIKDEKTFRNYYFCDIDVNSFKYTHLIYDVIEKYKKKYKEIDMTSSFWILNKLRYKLFKKGNYFSDWHSEHNFVNPYRLLAIQIYLTDHNCGTEFFFKKTILSKSGRICLFPAYFTHTHKGQPDFKKNRSIITGYVEFIKKGLKE